MIEFRKNASRETLYDLAVKNGVAVPEDADRGAIIDALTAHNMRETAGGAAEGAETAPDGGWTDDTGGEENAAQRPAEDGRDGNESGADGETEDMPPDGTAGDAEATQDGGGDNDKTAGKQPAKGAEEYGSFIYAGPSIPNGRLKENAVFRGKLSDVLEYLADVVKDYPQVPRLIVPTSRLAAFSVKVKTPGNIAHKYYNDILSAVRARRGKGGVNGG